jgi:two-component system, cell cycle sensor histidine kinase and response regulator CckA
MNSNHQTRPVTGNGKLTTRVLHAYNCGTGHEVRTFDAAADISGRKQPEFDPSQLAAMVESSDDAIFVKDLDGIITSWNKGAMMIFGYTADEIVGTSIKRLIPVERLDEENQILEKIRRGESMETFETLRQTKDGRQIYVSVTASPVADATGKIIGVSKVARKITARKRTEEKVKLFRTLIENLGDAIHVVDPVTGCFLDVNESACRVLGYTREEHLSLTVFDVVVGLDRALFDVAFARAKATGPLTLEAQHRRKDGTAYSVEVNLSSITLDREYVVVGVRDITERKQAETALRESEESYRKLFQNMVEGFAYCRMIFENGEPKDWIYLSVNRAFENLTDLKDVIGKRVSEVIPDIKETDPKLFQIYGRVSTTGKTERCELFVKGLQQWFDISVYSPKKEYFVAVFDVITERKRAEAELEYERNLLRTMLDNSPDHIYFKDTQSRFVKASKALADQFGVNSPDEIVGKTDFDFFGEAHARPAFEDEQEIIRTGRSMIAKEEREVWKNGHVTWVSSTKLPMRDVNRNIIGIMGISRDVTERKRAEESQARLATAVEQAAETIVITDTRGTILYANPAFEKTTGYTRAEAIGQNPRLLKSGKQDPEFYRRMWEVLGRGETWSGQFTNRRKDGGIYQEEASISPVRDAAGAIVNYVAVKRDVTREKQLEAQMHQAQKMEAIGQLAGGVAHDFNNMLSVIIGYGEMIMADLDSDSPLRHYAGELRRAADRATGLTRQLLMFSRKQKVEPVVLDLNDTVRDLNKILRRLIGENIELSVVPGNQIGHIMADPGHVGQVLMNLAVNARDAMPNGGKLIIATSNVTLDEHYTRTHAGVTPGDYVMLSISDTGSGMTPEVKAHLFEALFTTKPADKGTGLGLAICQTIVQQSGGHIDVESEVGRGATFRIYFPWVNKPVEPEGGLIQSGPLPRGTETVLLVEDEPSVRNLAANVLEALGYPVLRANNGQEALRLVREHKGPPIRLVVTDVIMPQMGGKVMADWLKTTDPDLKILFTSGYTDDAIAQQGVLEPGVAFLAKPYTPEALARKVRDVLDQSAAPQPDSMLEASNEATPPGS